MFNRTVEVLGKKVCTPYFNQSSIGFYLEVCLSNSDYSKLSKETRDEICDLIHIYFFEENKPSA